MSRSVWVSVVSVAILGAAGFGAWHVFRGAPAGGGSPAAVAGVSPAPAPAGASGSSPGSSAGSGKPSGPPGGPGGGMPPVPVEVITVKAGALDDEALSVGTLRSNESVVIRTEVAGRVLKVGFTDGQTVASGALLLKIDDSIAAAEVSQAKAEMGLALENLRRVQDLKEKNFVSASALDQAAAAHEVAKAKLELAQARLKRYTLTAPFAGTVGLRNLTAGDYIKEGADVVAVEDLSSMRLDFRLPEKMNPVVRAGSTLRANFEAYPGRDFMATVIAVDPQIDPAGRSVLIRARLANPGSILKPGMLARVTLSLGQRNNVLMVPEEAVVPQGGDAFVYRVIEGKAVKTPVRLGLRRPGQVEIASGVQVGDQIVVAGQIRIGRDQAPVRIMGSAS